MPISFYPGPSTVYKEIPEYVKEAYEKGILSINHRSGTFAEVLKNTLQLLKNKLNIPDGYEIVFTSSATECWEVIAQSIIIKQSYHLFNGDFGRKWFEYTQKLVPDSGGYQFDINEELPVDKITVPEKAEIICLTQNETSNGTEINQATIKELKNKYPEKLLAVDATSSMGGIFLDFAHADFWFASVQKCFGLPAGLGILVCSPAAIEKAYKINENKHYNSMIFMLDNIRNLQTHYTPNVLGIYLLMKVMEANQNIHKIEERLKLRFDDLQNCLDAASFQNLIINKKVRSTTVLAIKGNSENVVKVKKVAEKHGILLGNGYGSLKKETFRIANFPAIPDADFHLLKDFLINYSTHTF